MEYSSKAIAGVCLATMLLCTPVMAQKGIGEWFNQKKTQKKYYLEQIAALQVYLGYLKDGYKVSKDGIHLVRDIRKGEFSLHKDYFSSLRQVNPALSNMQKTKAVRRYYKAIVSRFNKLVTETWYQHGITESERAYIEKVKSKVLRACDLDIDGLELVLRSGATEMSDDQRLRQIGNIHASMQDKHEFTLSFIRDIRLLCAARKKTATDVEVSRKLLNIPKQQ